MLIMKKSKLFNDYIRNIKLGPDHICVSCDRLFFKRIMKNIHKTEIDLYNLKTKVTQKNKIQHSVTMAHDEIKITNQRKNHNILISAF